jgi:aconitate hydratase
MGVLPLQFKSGDSAASLGLTGQEEFAIIGIAEGLETNFARGKTVTVRATDDGGTSKVFEATVRIDTPKEVEYYRHGGILQYVLRQLLKS